MMMSEVMGKSEEVMGKKGDEGQGKGLTRKKLMSRRR